MQTGLESEIEMCYPEIAEAGAGAENGPLGWERRVFIVSLTGLIPGIQLGCIMNLLMSPTVATFYIIAALGGILGMIAGGMLEADHWV